jgi:hypothetical protein
MDELTELRAALIQLAKTLESQRLCVLRIVAVIERRMAEENTAAPKIQADNFTS